MKQPMLWIGSYADREAFERLRALGYRNAAAQLSQANLLEGIERLTGATFDAIGAAVLLGYPGAGPRRVPEIRFQHAPGASDVLVGFCNAQYLNRLLSARRLGWQVARWAAAHPEARAPEVFVYEMRSGCLRAAARLKRRVPGARIHLIVPDLPGFMDLHMGPLKRALKALDGRAIRRWLRFVDDYILYAAPMAEYLGIPQGKWLLMEGSVRPDDATPIPQTPGDGTTVAMYSGYLDERYGVLSLVDAMEHLDDGFRLWITGSGPAQPQIARRAQEDPRISDFGFLPSREALLLKQRQATMLVNMRRPEAAASSYCFPSKLFEYMLSGRPVLSCRLGGIPEEYFDYLIEMKDASPTSIAEAIARVAAMPEPERAAIGRRGRAFVAAQKSSLAQARRILAFLGLEVRDE